MYVAASVSDAYSLQGSLDCSRLALFKFFDDSMLENWPSFNPHNFSQFKPNEPSNPSKMTPVTYCPTHDRTLPPPDQVIVPEGRNILLRHLYQNAEEKLRHKRGSSDNLPPERPSKMSRASSNSI